MRCYFVNVEGRLTWQVKEIDQDAFQPAALSGLRFVLASDEGKAVAKAIKQIKTDLAVKYDWDCLTHPRAEWSIEEVQLAAYSNLLKRRYGFIFSQERGS